MNTYAYDAANRLTSVSDSSSIATYTYNGLDDRLTQNGIQYTLDLNTMLTQVLDDGTNTYTYGLGRISQQSESTPEYFLGDALGSVRQLTSQNGQVAFAQSYDPYGVVTHSSGESHTDFAFTGEQLDASGLTYLRARYYNPVDGRFFQRDPWDGDPNLPATLNPYAYVLNNPVMYTDPSGMIPQLLAAMGVGFLAGVGIGAAVGIFDRGWALSGDCGCDIRELALSMEDWQWVGWHALASGIIGGATPLIALAVAGAPLGAILIGGAGIVLGGWDLYNTINIIIKEQNGHPTWCTGIRAAIDIAAIVFGVGLVGKGALSVWRSGGSVLKWFAPAGTKPVPPPITRPLSDVGRQLKAFVSGNLEQGGWRSATIKNTPYGNIDTGAQVSVNGRQLILKDAFFYPEGERFRAIGISGVRYFVRELSWVAKEMGYESLRIIGHRISGANPNHIWDTTIDLTILK